MTGVCLQGGIGALSDGELGLGFCSVAVGGCVPGLSVGNLGSGWVGRVVVLARRALSPSCGAICGFNWSFEFWRGGTGLACVKFRCDVFSPVSGHAHGQLVISLCSLWCLTS